MLKTTTIQQLWTKFQIEVMHPEASATQVKCMREAFISGFGAMLYIYMRISELDKMDGVRYLEALEAELEKLVRDISEQVR